MRQHELAVNAILHLPIILGFGCLLLMLWPVPLLIMIAFYTCGLIDLVYAKLPLLRHRVFHFFGPSHIPTRRRDAYFRGYKRLALGLAMNILLLIHCLVLSEVA